MPLSGGTNTHLRTKGILVAKGARKTIRDLQTYLLWKPGGGGGIEIIFTSKLFLPSRVAPYFSGAFGAVYKIKLKNLINGKHNLVKSIFRSVETTGERSADQDYFYVRP